MHKGLFSTLKHKTMKNSYLLLSICFFIMVSCSKPFTYKDNGCTFELSEDDPFTIVLEGEANSDYNWELASNLVFVKLNSPITKTAKGKTIEYTFNFKAIAEGEDKILLNYTHGNNIKKNFTITVIIGEIGLIEAK